MDEIPGAGIRVIPPPAHQLLVRRNRAGVVLSHTDGREGLPSPGEHGNLGRGARAVAELAREVGAPAVGLSGSYEAARVALADGDRGEDEVAADGSRGEHRVTAAPAVGAARDRKGAGVLEAQGDRPEGEPAGDEGRHQPGGGGAVKDGSGAAVSPAVGLAVRRQSTGLD